jgi:hypothetical protein
VVSPDGTWKCDVFRMNAGHCDYNWSGDLGYKRARITENYFGCSKGIDYYGDVDKKWPN